MFDLSLIDLLKEKKNDMSVKSLCRLKSSCIKHLLSKGPISLHLDLICSVYFKVSTVLGFVYVGESG